MGGGPIFDPFKIKDVEFKNRIIRSSIGGRTAYYTGEINPAWIKFESIFAKNHLAGIISPTITVDENRWSPIEYPKLSNDKFVDSLKAAVTSIKNTAIGGECRYIMQLGDTGYHTQTSLFSQYEDAMSASRVFDLLFGYRNGSIEMSTSDIHKTIRNFANAAKRVQETGCDGLEITASKGYIIHQFLNPATNRRKDAYGGTVEKRFRFLREIIDAVNEKLNINKNFIFGIRLSAKDYNYLPFPNLRLALNDGLSPFSCGWRQYWFGNGLQETIYYAQELEKLGIDYFHISNGFGFINPKESPGEFPVEEVKMFMDSTRHLSGKALARSFLLNLLPNKIIKLLYRMGWETDGKAIMQAKNSDDAAKFKQAVNVPVISNGGFQDKQVIENAINEKKCDFISMARPLLANPELLAYYRDESNAIGKPCSYCNKCSVRTTLFPLGCYDIRRYLDDTGKSPTPYELRRAQEYMEKSILEFNQPYYEN